MCLYMSVLLKNMIARMPQSPGVYQFIGATGDVLYVGKARRLRSRVASYFDAIGGPSADLSAAKKQMVGCAVRISYAVTPSESEALLLEATLIKRYRPTYNIVLRDDKFYAYLKIDLDHIWPSVMRVRRPPVRRRKSKYFGPYISSRAVGETIRVIKEIFPYCTAPLQPGKRPRPCFQYHLGRCPGACIGLVNPEQYRESFEGIITFLKGDMRAVIRLLEQKMQKAAQVRAFEIAARMRDQIQALYKMAERQSVIHREHLNEDYLCPALGLDQSAVAVMRVREGRLIDVRPYLLQHERGVETSEVTFAFAEQYYAQTDDVPHRVYIADVARRDDEEPPLAYRNITVMPLPVRGTKRRLWKMGTTNAYEYLLQQQNSHRRVQANALAALSNLEASLGITHHLKRIEMFDVSNIQGTDAIGAMAVFVDGMPVRAYYRLFRIKDLQSPDDVGMMREMLSRRFRDVASGRYRGREPLPDLVVLDGGKGQLHMAMQVLEGHRINVPCIALAKKKEEIFLPQKKDPLHLPPESSALLLLRRMRDEAHRFGITRYRAHHRKKMKASMLDEIPGIGPESKRKLLRAFGSVAFIKQASLVDLARVVGATRAEILEQTLKNGSAVTN